MLYQSHKCYTKANIIYNISKFTGLTVYEVSKIINALIDIFKEEMLKGKKIRLRDWGVMYIKTYKPTIYYGHPTGPRPRVVFESATKLKKKVFKDCLLNKKYDIL